MAPVKDGYFLPDYPGNIRNRSEHSMVPEMIGQTREDGMIYALGCEYCFITRDLYSKFSGAAIKFYDFDSTYQCFSNAISFHQVGKKHNFRRKKELAAQD